MAQKKKKFNVKKFIVSLLVTVAILASLASLLYFGRDIVSSVQTIVAGNQAKKGEYDSAVEIYRYAIRFSSKKAKPFIELGKLYEEHGERNTALRVYEAGFMANGSALLHENAERLSAAYAENDVKKEVEVKKEIKDNVKTLAIESGDTYVLSTYTYDAEGLPELIVKTNALGDFVGRSEYSYDDEGNVEGSVEYELQFSKYAEYSEGHLVKETGKYIGQNKREASLLSLDDGGYATMSRDGDYTVTYSYNSQGQITGIEIVSGNGTESITYEYEKSGRLKSKNDNNVITVYEYDKAGKLITETTEMNEEQKSEIAYQYFADKQGICERRSDTSFVKVTIETVDSRNRKKTEEVWQPTELKEEYYDYEGDVLYAKRNYLDEDYDSSYTYYYDGDGYLSKAVFYKDETPSICYVDKYTYDKSHNVITKETYYPGENKEFFDNYEYSKDGVLSAVLSKKEGDEPGTSVDTYTAYVYDEEGNIIEENEYRINSKEIQVVSVNENEEGKEVRTEEYDSFGVNTASTIVFYDLDGRIEKEIITNPVTSVLESFRENKYDSKGRLSETVLYGENAGMKEHLFYVYDDFGRIDYVYSAKNDTNRKVEEYTYNDQGLLVSKKVTGGDIVYNYDKNGRLTVETFTEPFKGTVVSKTKYSY